MMRAWSYLWRRWLRTGLGAVLIVLPAGASGPVEHEFFAADPREDLELKATTFDGVLPAALQTPSGPVLAPTGYRDPLRAKTSYGGGATPSSPDATYRIDRNTERPDVVSYDEPFSPSIAPFKRLYAFDRVGDALELRVAERSLSPLVVGGDLRPGEDAFYADLFVDLIAGVPVRIPNVGPGARLIFAHTEPKLPIEVVKDGADNWFVRAKETRRVRLVMQLSIQRDVFGSPFLSASWERLRARAPSLSAAARREVAAVTEHIGIEPEASPAQALSQLVAYFRGFSASEESLQAGSSLELYSELARLRRGVCRHRAYAFVVTALGLGFPARFVHNEAHAWVEVFDTNIWHRIDLGGAAQRLDFNEAEQVGVHVPPADPYLWPEGSSSAQSMLHGSASQSTDPNPSTAASSGPRPVPPPSLDTPLVASPGKSPGLFELAPGTAANVQRGEPLTLSGKLSDHGKPCAQARVDVFLKSAAGSGFLGSLATGEQGRFEGQVVVPRSLSVGDYELILRSRETTYCAAGTSD